jgi:hypothetical protein
MSVRPSFYLSVCLSVCPTGTTRFPVDGCSWNLTFEYFLKIFRENSNFIKIWNEWRAIYLKTKGHFWSYLAEFFLELKIYQAKIVEKIRTYILCSLTFSSRSCRLWDFFLFTKISNQRLPLWANTRCLWDNVKKYGRAEQATDDNIIRRMCIACWIPKATKTLSEYAILIAFSLQQWLHVLRQKYPIHILPVLFIYS